MLDDARVRSAVAGDLDSLTVLLTESYVQIRGRLAARIPRTLRSLIDVDDLVQNAHIAVFRKISQLHPADLNSFQRWVSAIALNELRGAIRGARARKRGGDWTRQSTGNPLYDSATFLLEVIAATSHTASRSTIRREDLGQLKEALAVLPPDERQAVDLVHLQNLSVAEAAARMQRTDRAIHNLCYSARQRLKAVLIPTPTKYPG